VVALPPFDVCPGPPQAVTSNGSTRRQWYTSRLPLHVVMLSLY